MLQIVKEKIIYFLALAVLMERLDNAQHYQSKLNRTGNTLSIKQSNNSLVLGKYNKGRDGRTSELSLNSMSHLNESNLTRKKKTSKNPQFQSYKENQSALQKHERHNPSQSCASSNPNASNISNSRNTFHKTTAKSQFKTSKFTNRKDTYGGPEEIIMEDNNANYEQSINQLIQDNIKKNKKLKEEEQLKKLEEWKKQKQAKEQLGERNRVIREMNAKSLSRSRATMQEPSWWKQTCGASRRQNDGKSKNVDGLQAQKTVLTESERRTMLGLDFVDLKEKVIGSKHRKKETDVEPHAGTSKTLSKEKKIEIHQYMALKRGRINMERENLEEEDKQKKTKITENKQKLQSVVSKIFSASQKRKKARSPSVAKKKSRKKTGITHLEENIEDSYLLNNRNEELMNEIKENLLMEIDPKKEKTEDNDKKLLYDKMVFLANRYQKLIKNPSYEIETFQNSSIVNVFSAIKIQKYYRGYLARKAYKKLLLKTAEENNKQEEKEKIEKVEKKKKLEKFEKLEKANVDQKPKEMIEKHKSLDLKTEPLAQQIVSPKPAEEANVNSSFEFQNLEKLLQGLESKSQNEKVVHLSRINTIEDGKDEIRALEQEQNVPHNAVSKFAKEFSVGTQVAQKLEVIPEPPQQKECKTVETQTIEPEIKTEEPEQKRIKKNLQIAIPEGNFKKQINKSSSLTEMRFLLGSEQLLKECTAQAQLDENPAPQSAKAIQNIVNECVKTPSDNNLSEAGHIKSIEMLIESETQNKQSIFKKNTFQEFTLKKFKEFLKEDSLSKLISVREKVMKYKESTEKRFIQKMYKAKKFSPRTYQSKKKELEKWITKEKAVIKKSKRTIMDTWKKTAQMIEDAHKNTLQIKHLLVAHTPSYNSGTNSSISIVLDSNRPETERNLPEEIKLNEEDSHKKLAHDNSLENLSDILLSGEQVMSPQSTSGKFPRSDEKDNLEKRMDGNSLQKLLISEEEQILKPQEKLHYRQKKRMQY